MAQLLFNLDIRALIIGSKTNLESDPRFGEVLTTKTQAESFNASLNRACFYTKGLI